MADLGPGTMPRGKYPESPAPAGPTPLFPERRPREACSMPLSGCHDLPLATFNLPSRNSSQSNRKRIPQTKNLLACPAAGRGAVNSVAACVSDHSRGQALAPANPLSPNGNNAPPQNQKPKPLVLPLPRRHAWLAGPPANTCSRNKPSKQTATAPPTKTKSA